MAAGGPERIVGGGLGHPLIRGHHPPVFGGHLLVFGCRLLVFGWRAVWVDAGAGLGESAGKGEGEGVGLGQFEVQHDCRGGRLSGRQFDQRYAQPLGEVTQRVRGRNPSAPFHGGDVGGGVAGFRQGPLGEPACGA